MERVSWNQAVRPSTHDLIAAINSGADDIDRIDGALDDIETDLDGKAGVSGTYPDFVAGEALSIRSGIRSNAFLTRQLDADVADGIAEIERVLGNTVVWNQAVPDAYATRTSNGITISKTGGVYTVTGTSTGYVEFKLLNNFPLKNGHKMLFMQMHTQNSGFTILLYSNTTSSRLNASRESYIYTPTQNHANTELDFIVDASGVTINDTFTLMIFDLTVMFGAGNEPSTVAEFEAQYGSDYKPYSAPRMIDTHVLGLHSTGFNIWDEEWENSTISTITGQKIPGYSGQIRCKNYIPVMGGTEYYLACPATINAWIFCYDKDLNPIPLPNLGQGQSGVAAGCGNRAFTTPSNAVYMMFYMISAYGSTYKHDICINISNPAFNGTYKPYWAGDTLEFPTQTLRGIGTAQDVMTSTGIERKIHETTIASDAQIVKTGTDTTSGLIQYCVWLEAADPLAMNARWPVRSEKFSYKSQYYGSPVGEYTMALNPGTKQILFSVPDSIATVADFRPLVSGMTIVYGLATPTIETFDTPIDLTYTVQEGGTEAWIAPNGTQSAAVTGEIAYPLDPARALITHESFADFIDKLGAYIGATITETWDGSKYTYSFASGRTALLGSIDAEPDALEVTEKDDMVKEIIEDERKDQ